VASIVFIIERALAGRGRARPSVPASHYLYDHTTPRLLATPPWTAYIKIADGCNHRCRFCVIPRLRGRMRCRPLASVLAEARALAAAGVREVNLVAQDTTAYGWSTPGSDLAALLARLAPLPGLRWVRLLYAYPNRVGPWLIDAMASHPTICHYLDLPFQHADRDLLRRMGRPGDGDSYLELIARLRAAMPDIALRSSFLVGFPGEDDRAFQRLLDFLEAAQLDRVGAFPYSREPGTPAAEMPDQVPAELAQARYHELMSRQQAISLARNQLWVGRQMEVLIESRGRSSRQWIGRSFRDAPEIDGSVIVTSPRPLRPGRFLQATITCAQPYDLVGQVGRRSPRRTACSTRKSRSSVC
jgi:ribosomal protein S12 methylthiotransferase